MLKKFVVVAACWACCLAYATPDAGDTTANASGSDAINQFLQDKGIVPASGMASGDTSLVQHISSVGQNVTTRASSLVVTAMGFLGVPYARGGTDADTGFDCSGFVRAIYEQTLGFLLPRVASQQAAATMPIDKSELKPGDLVFFNTMRRAFSHVGMYIGDNKFIHSPKPGGEVRVEDLRIGYWQRHFDGARRVIQARTLSADNSQR